MTTSSCHIDDFGPLPLVQPGSIAELGEVVRQARADDRALYPVGGQTQTHLGLSPIKPGLAVDTRRLTQIIDYPARDMTITVQAGLTVAGLQNTLAGENQRLPIDVPHADQATVGGILATNVSGPRRYGWGTLRDYVIGISVINDEGQETKAGGRVVKNVAGYDLCKLYVGSLGTLGIISQVTFKLRPVPAVHALFGFAVNPDELGAALDQLQASRTRPVCVEVLNPLAATELPICSQPRWMVVVGFEDTADALNWQVQQLITEMGGRFDVCGEIGPCAVPMWRKLTDFAGEKASWSFTASVLPSRVAETCRLIDALGPPARLLSHAGNGIVVAHAEECAPAMIQRLRASIEGHVVVTRCPPALKTVELVWGPPRSDWALMRTIKERLDPKNLFNPGRFV